MAYAASTRAQRGWQPERQFWREVGENTHVVLRIGAALLFMQHGAQKLLGWFGGMGGEGGTAELASLMGLAGVLEMFGGLLLLIGMLTRPVALLLVGQMGAAYVIAHLPQGVVPILNQGELALLYGLTFLFFLGNGAGKWSVDNWWANRHRAEGEMRRPVEAAAPRRRGHAA